MGGDGLERALIWINAFDNGSGIVCCVIMREISIKGLHAARAAVAVLLSLAWLSAMASPVCFPDISGRQGSVVGFSVVERLADRGMDYRCVAPLDGARQPSPVPASI